MSAEGIQIRSEVGPFAVVPEALIFDVRLSAQAVRLWAALARYADREGRAWPSRRTLARGIDVSPATVDRSARELEAAGWLRIERRKGEGETHYLSSIYTLTIAESPARAGDPDGGSSPVMRGGPSADHPREGGPPVDQGGPSADQGWSARDDKNESQLNEKNPPAADAARGERAARERRSSTSEPEPLALVTDDQGGPWQRPPADAVRRVFDAWAASTGRADAVLDRRRRQVIARALTVAPLARVVAAVEGWRYDRWSNGEYDGEVRDRISELIGDADKIDRFAGARARGSVPAPRRRLSAHEQQQADLAAAAHAAQAAAQVDPSRALGAGW